MSAKGRKRLFEEAYMSAIGAKQTFPQGFNGPVYEYTP
jgi:hypothetical protein